MIQAITISFFLVITFSMHCAEIEFNAFGTEGLSVSSPPVLSSPLSNSFSSFSFFTSYSSNNLPSMDTPTKHDPKSNNIHLKKRQLGFTKAPIDQPTPSTTPWVPIKLSPQAHIALPLKTKEPTRIELFDQAGIRANLPKIKNWQIAQKIKQNITNLPENDFEKLLKEVQSIDPNQKQIDFAQLPLIRTVFLIPSIECAQYRQAQKKLCQSLEIDDVRPLD